MEYLYNLYKFWTMGQLKRQWIRGDIQGQGARVVLELMHEPPAPEPNTSHSTVLWDWFKGIWTHIQSQFAADGIQPLYAMQFNDNGLLLQTQQYSNVTVDIVTTESLPSDPTTTWWKGDCSTVNMGYWITLLNAALVPNISKNKVILDTDGNFNCRDNNAELSAAAVVAEYQGYNFVHLEDDTTTINGNAMRDTAAIKNIAIAYHDCDPPSSCQ